MPISMRHTSTPALKRLGSIADLSRSQPRFFSTSGWLWGADVALRLPCFHFQAQTTALRSVYSLQLQAGPGGAWKGADPTRQIGGTDTMLSLTDVARITVYGPARLPICIAPEALEP